MREQRRFASCHWPRDVHFGGDGRFREYRRVSWASWERLHKLMEGWRRAGRVSVAIFQGGHGWEVIGDGGEG